MHFIARLAQIFRRGETCGTSADDANGLPAIRAGHEWPDPTFFPCGIRDELFNRTDGDGAVAGKFNDATALAQAIPRTRSEENKSELQSLMSTPYDAPSMNKTHPTTNQ